MMEQFTIKEFMERLQADSLRLCTVTGLVKKSGNATEILFKTGYGDSGWIKIPVAMISTVALLKNVACDEDHCTLVKLHLAQPATTDGKVLYELLSAISQHGSCKCQGYAQHEGCQCAYGNASKPFKYCMHEPHLCPCGCGHYLNKPVNAAPHW